jgi:hypothetical protein
MAITEEEKEKLRHFALWYSSPVYREEYLEIVSRIDTVEDLESTYKQEEEERLDSLSKLGVPSKLLGHPEALDPDNLYYNHRLNTLSEGTEAVEEEEQEGSLLLGPEGQEILKGYLDQLNRAGAGTEVQKEEERQATIEERLDALEENRQGFTLHKQELQRLDVSHRLLLKRVEETEEAGLEFGDDITSLRDGQFSSNRRIDELLDRSVHDAELYGKCKERLNTHNALLDTLNAKIDSSNKAGDEAIGELRHRDAMTNGRINSLTTRLRNGGGSLGI